MKNLSLSILTLRELQVAEALAWGASVKEVPYLIQRTNSKIISEETVRTLKKNIYEKFGIQKASELSAVYMHLHYNISLEHTPLARILVVSFLMLITLPSLVQTNDYVRQFRASRTLRASRCSRARKSSNTYELC